MTENTALSNGEKPELAHGEDGMTRAEFEQAKADGIAYETHKKMLAQRARFKEDADRFRSELEAYKEKELQQQGKTQELIEAQRKRIAELEETSKKREANFQWNVVGAQIKSELSSRGVRSPDKALKYAVAAHKDDLSTIEVDDQYNVNSDDLRRFVDKFLADNADMGFVGSVGVKDMVPKTIKVKEEKPDINKLSRNELNSLIWKMEGR